MKKIIYPIILLVLSVSCKKQYTCQCAQNSATIEMSVFKKNEAREGCEQNGGWGNGYNDCHLIE